ncbi:uncharacterized protein LOC141673076 [Apium graveolens]|uniref:uncharacterized protein LOC141673076 n=1 Tax=Apium graveolens TaxID=4045 RepID=UPI003D78F43E
MWNSMKRLGSGTSSWLQEKFFDPLLVVLQRGAEPSELAFSAAVGITFGIFPICGVTVFLCGLAIAALGSRCNAPTVIMANCIATPVELSLIIPFLRLGEFLTGGDHFPLTSDALKMIFKGQASQEILQSVFRAMLGWLVAAPIILAALYLVFLPCFTIMVRRYNSGPPSPRTPLLSLSDVNLKVRDV